MMEAVKKVLIVDDNPTVLRLLAIIVGGAGLEAIKEGNPKNAKDRLNKGQEQIDFLILDGLNGKWHELSQLAISLGIPVVVVSADEDIVRQAADIGVLSIDKGTKNFVASILLFISAKD